MCVYHLLKDKYKFKKSLIWDLHDGLMVKNLPCNAWDMGLIPGLGTKIPHVVGHSLKKKIKSKRYQTLETNSREQEQ